VVIEFMAKSKVERYNSLYLGFNYESVCLIGLGRTAQLNLYLGFNYESVNLIGLGRTVQWPLSRGFTDEPVHLIG